MADKAEVSALAQNLLKLFRFSFDVGENHFYLSARMAPEDGEVVDILVRNANAAKFEAKALLRWPSKELSSMPQVRFIALGAWMDLTHDFFAPCNDSIMSRINWRTLNSGQQRTGIGSHGTRQVARLPCR